MWSSVALSRRQGHHAHVRPSQQQHAKRIRSQMDDRFELPDRLSQALAGNTRGLSFSSATWGVRFPEVDDLATLPPNASFVGLGMAPKNLEVLRRANRLVAIKTLLTTSDVVNELQHVRTLRMAVLITLKLTDNDLRVLTGCKKLEHLGLFYAKGITDLGFLADMPQLRSLYLCDMPRLDFANFPSMPSLQEFVFDGGVHKAVKVASFSPLSRLSGLRRLELFNVEAIDGSLAPLAVLQGLQHLFISARAFEAEEYARLAASLPNTQGAGADCLNPLFTKPKYFSNGEAHLPCPKCFQPRVILTGKGTPVSCLTCNAKRIEKHIARWEAAREPF